MKETSILHHVEFCSSKTSLCPGSYALAPTFHISTMIDGDDIIGQACKSSAVSRAYRPSLVHGLKPLCRMRDTYVQRSVEAEVVLNALWL